MPYLGADSVAAACANTLNCLLWALRILLAAAGARWLWWLKLAGHLTVWTEGAAKASREWPVARPWILIMPPDSTTGAAATNAVPGAIAANLIVEATAEPAPPKPSRFQGACSTRGYAKKLGNQQLGFYS